MGLPAMMKSRPHLHHVRGRFPLPFYRKKHRPFSLEKGRCRDSVMAQGISPAVIVTLPLPLTTLVLTK